MAAAGSGRPSVETAGGAGDGRPPGDPGDEPGPSAAPAGGSPGAGQPRPPGQEPTTAEQPVAVVPPEAPPARPPAPIRLRTPRVGRTPRPAGGGARTPPPGPEDQPTRAVPVLGPPRPPRSRNRLLPRTVLGLSMLLLATSVGAAFSGVTLYSYYEYRLSKTTDKINTLTVGYQKALDNARADLNAQRAAAKAEIDKELAPLRQLQTTADTLQALVKKAAPSMFFVHTLDSTGQPSVGSAFVVASNPTRSLLLTSYATVAAATVKPGPDLFVRQGDQDTKVTVWTWDDRYDLALIVLAKGNLPVLAPAPTSPPPAVGDQVFALSGLGSLGASAVQGIVTDVSAQAIQHSAPVGQAYQGGPLLNAAGQVTAIASRTYRPLNFTSDGIWFAPYELSACSAVLSCPGGTISGEPAAAHS